MTPESGTFFTHEQGRSLTDTWHKYTILLLFSGFIVVFQGFLFLILGLWFGALLGLIHEIK